MSASDISNKVWGFDKLEKSIDSELQRSERLKQSVLQCAFGGILSMGDLK